MFKNLRQQEPTMDRPMYRPDYSVGYDHSTGMISLTIHNDRANSTIFLGDRDISRLVRILESARSMEEDYGADDEEE